MLALGPLVPRLLMLLLLGATAAPAPTTPVAATAAPTLLLLLGSGRCGRSRREGVVPRWRRRAWLRRCGLRMPTRRPGGEGGVVDASLDFLHPAFLQA